MNINDILAQIKVKCEITAKKMNSAELSIWDATHESELKQFHGFTDQSLKQRKLSLLKNKS